MCQRVISRGNGMPICCGLMALVADGVLWQMERRCVVLSRER